MEYIYVVYYLSLGFAAAMLACLVMRRRFAALVLSSTASLLFASATAIALDLHGPQLLAPFAPAAAGPLACATIAGNEDVRQSPSAAVAAPTIFLLTVTGSLYRFEKAWHDLCGLFPSESSSLNLVLYLIVAVCAALFVSVLSQELDEDGRRSYGRLLVFTVAGFALALEAVDRCISQGGLYSSDSHALSCLALGTMTATIASLAESWAQAGWATRIASLLSIIAPFLSLILLPGVFPIHAYRSFLLPVAAAFVAAVLLYASGWRFTPIYIAALSILWGIVFSAFNGDGFERWLSTAQDSLGAGWASTQVCGALEAFHPGLETVPNRLACSPYCNYCLSGTAYGLGTFGLVICGAALVFLVGALVELWRERSQLLALATATLIAFSAFVSLADQTAILPLYGTSMPFFACSSITASVLTFLITLCMLDAHRWPAAYIHMIVTNSHNAYNAIVENEDNQTSLP